MGTMIQIRNVPDELHRTLKMRAAAEGMSLSDFLKRDLEVIARRSSIAEIEERVAARGRSGLRTATVLAALREVRDG